MERAFRPAHAPRGTAYRTVRPSCLRRLRIGRGSIRRHGREYPWRDQLAKPLLVQTGPCVILRQDTFQRRVVSFDRRHGIVNDLPDFGLRRSRLQMGPSRFLRNPEDAGCAVLVRIFRIGALSRLRDEFIVLRFKGIRDVFQKDQPENDVLVLRRVHVVAKRVGSLPELGFEAQIRSGFLCGRLLLCSYLRHQTFQKIVVPRHSTSHSLNPGPYFRSSPAPRRA